MWGFSVTTQLYYLTNQLHILVTVNSHNQADPKNAAAILVGDIAAAFFLSFHILGVGLMMATSSG
jgi:hypothetical protein